MRRSSLSVALVVILSSVTAFAAPKGKARPKKAPAPAAPAKPAAAPASAKSIEGAVNPGDRPAAAPAADAQASAPAPKGPTRIDFDDRLVEGQTNKSGAVYLYDRKDLEVDSMVKQRSTYREEIARGLFE